MQFNDNLVFFFVTLTGQQLSMGYWTFFYFRLNVTVKDASTTKTNQTEQDVLKASTPVFSTAEEVPQTCMMA